MKTTYTVSELQELIKAMQEGNLQLRNKDTSAWIDVNGNQPFCFLFEYRVKPIENKKVKMWKWVIRTKGQLPYETPRFFTSERDVLLEHPNYEIIQRIDSSMIEVEE